MIDSKALLAKSPQLVYNFGGPDNFVELLSKKGIGDDFIFRILSHSGLVIGLSPVNMVFSFVSGLTRDSGILNTPYQIFSITGDLIYSVVNRSLLFGESILDKALILDSDTFDSYYLQYRTPTAYKNVLIIVNKMRLIDKDFASFTENMSDKILISNASTNNQLILVGDNLYIDDEDVFLNPYDVKISFLPDLSSSIPSKEDIVTNYKTTENVFSAKHFFSYDMLLTTSGWITFYQDTKEGRQFLNAIPTLGKGVDRFIEASPKVYYVALSHDEFPLDFREIISIPDREPGSIEDNTVDLRIDLRKDV